jgi:uncharacterized membrane protein YeaQ/YmgE (transglycosylase-associated protein family)
MHWLWVIIVGFVAGLIARWLSPAPNNPQGFIFTTALGIVGSVVMTLIGRALHWYRPGEGAGIFGSIVGALIVLWLWHMWYRSQHPPAA